MEDQNAVMEAEIQDMTNAIEEIDEQNAQLQ